ncbi:hypothetical protein [Micromonospora cathayae]|uniref:Nucleotidyl transferase AbiEii toxin, Type IV TA system n=1 Tax=Micromonospora cathayae TaxID=3028804 RepID=A0ABY7ZU76_9ACTN|nr:hypothetical protein [Micromonospora sp. HUAS 3]WDZ85583.1 hypothetical protein PVK37_03770 [Micromonospora sp. HUAS 3]
MIERELDPLYVAARRVLLDALDALGTHRSALILVGAQAVYLRAGDADLETVAPFTTDADFGIDASRLGSDPDITGAMVRAGFRLKVKSGGNGVEPGSWLATTHLGGDMVSVEVDLMVPEALAVGHGKRDARLPYHGKNATRWAPGLEATVLDNDELPIASLEPERDPRTAVIRVAGPAALLVAKAHKLGERLGVGSQHRIRPKDAGDVFRIMRSPTPPTVIGRRLNELRRDPMCGASVHAGVRHLTDLFGAPRAPGVDLAVANLAGAVAEDEVRVLMPAYLDTALATYRD